MIGSLANHNRLHIASILIDTHWKLYQRYTDDKCLTIPADIKDEKLRQILKTKHSRKTYLLKCLENAETKPEMITIKQDILCSKILL